MRLPSETLSPTLTLSSATLPATGEGTSIVALSDSSVTSGFSVLTASPAFTSTSMTGTSWKSPMSGTSTLIVTMLLRPPSDQHAPQVGEQAGEVAVEAGRGGPVDHAVIPRQRQ